MEDRRRKEERSVKLRNMKEGWDVQRNRGGMKEEEKRRQKELRKLKESWKEEDREKEIEREVEERRRAWKWEMKNPGEFSGI